jgi:hypothetical protein
MAKQFSTDELPLPTAGMLLRHVFLRKWVGVVSGVYLVWGILDVFDSKIAPKLPVAFKATWDRYYILGLFSWKTWVMIGLAILTCVSLQGAYTLAHDYAKRYAKLMEHKLVFEVDERYSRVYLQERSEQRVVVLAEIRLRFENQDIHPTSMKSLDMTLHNLQGGEEISTWISAKYSSNGVYIEREQFEGMMIQGRRLTPFYAFEVIMTIDDEKIKTASDLNGTHYLRITMDSSHQKPFAGLLFLSWEDAFKDDGAPLTITFGAPVISRVSHRLD